MKTHELSVYKVYAIKSDKFRLRSLHFAKMVELRAQ